MTDIHPISNLHTGSGNTGSTPACSSLAHEKVGYILVFIHSRKWVPSDFVETGLSLFIDIFIHHNGR